MYEFRVYICEADSRIAKCHRELRFAVRWTWCEVPKVYQATCASCGYESPLTAGFYRGIVVDDVATIPEWAKHQDVERLAVLTHPAEQDVLDAIGYSDSKATFSGRVVDVDIVFCHGCGELYEVRRIGIMPGIGCSTAVATGIVAGVVLSFYMRLVIAFSSGIAAALIVFFFIERAMLSYVRRRFYNKNREFFTETKCPRCGCEPSEIEKGRLISCPKCHRRAMAVNAVGWS
jgi:DNA-directed RNA polymerase subunit RPC12/RpoP